MKGLGKAVAKGAKSAGKAVAKGAKHAAKKAAPVLKKAAKEVGKQVKDAAISAGKDIAKDVAKDAAHGAVNMAKNAASKLSGKVLRKISKFSPKTAEFIKVNGQKALDYMADAGLTGDALAQYADKFIDNIGKNAEGNDDKSTLDALKKQVDAVKGDDDAVMGILTQFVDASKNSNGGEYGDVDEQKLAAESAKRLNITREFFDRSRYFKTKYGELEMVSESGDKYKTTKGNVLIFV